MTEQYNIVDNQEELGMAAIKVTDNIGLGFGAIGSPEFTLEQAEAEAHEVAQFRRKIDWRNPAVCIDGRRLVRMEGVEALPLGAHIAGGAETLLVGAKSVGLELEGAELLALAKEKGFTLGGHVDTTNRENGFMNGTGCGACDKCESNCKLFAENHAAVEPTIQALLGNAFNKDHYDKTNLQPVTNSVRELVGEDLTEILNDDGTGVHGHREQMVVFNYDEDTTIDRDAYFDATGKEVFVIDMWYIKRLADAMASGEQASELYHAMVAFQVATYLGLCDGSHRAAIMQSS